MVRAVPGYRIERTIAIGGEAAVLAATAVEDGRPVALKVARADVPGAPARLAREAVALRILGPPAVPELHASGRLDDGTRWLALERIELPLLADLLEARAAPFPGDEAVRILRAVLAPVEALHRCGWAHCDLKPENVFLPPSGPARLVDLGLARGGSLPPPECDRDFEGTPAYMAPEQCERGGVPDARTDVYAAGVILHELLTGATPFTGSAAELREAHLARRPPRPSGSGVTAALQEVVLRCLEKDRAARYRDATALYRALADALGSAAPARTPLPGAANRTPARGEATRTPARVLASSTPAPASPAATPAPGAPPRASPPRATDPATPAGAPVRRPVGVVRFEGAGDALRARRTLEAFGGVLVETTAGRATAAFDASAAENPVRLALRCADALVARGIAACACVDLSSALVVRRKDGTTRILGVGAEDGSPAPAVPEKLAGVVVTGRAAAELPEVRFASVPGAPGLSRPTAQAGQEQATVVRDGGPPLLGRDDELAGLEAAARHAATGVPTVVVVLGEAGAGKSHLGAELARRLRGAPSAPDVLEVRGCSPLEGGGETALAALLRAALGFQRAVALTAQDVRLRVRAVVPALPEGAWAAAALALGAIREDAPALAAMAAAPGAIRGAAARVAGEALRRRAASRPLCVVLEDAHLADGSTLDALELATLAEHAAPVLVCALARPSFSAARPRFGERAGARRTLPLGPLDDEAADALLRTLLAPAEGIPASALGGLARRAERLPGLLVELARALRESGAILRRPAGGTWYLATDVLDQVQRTPPLEWIAERELRALPEDLRAHAQLCAALGDEITAQEIQGTLRELDALGAGARFPLEGRAGTKRLVDSGLLVSHRRGTLTFRQPLLRELFVRNLAPGERARIHEAAYRFLSTQAEGASRVLLARHAAASGRSAEAAELWLAMAADLRLAHAYVDSEGAYTRALEAVPDRADARRLAALLGRGLMRYRIGRAEDAVQDLSGARAVARALGDARAEVEALLEEATCRDWMDDFAGSRRCVGAAAALAVRERTALAEVRLGLAEGRALFREGRWKDSVETLGAVVGRAEALGDEGYETHVAALVLLGTALPHLDRAAEAADALRRAEALAAPRGDALHLSAILTNRRNLRVATGDLRGAIADQEASIKIGRELGMVGIEYYGAYNIAELLYQAGDGARALGHLRRAVEIEQGHPEAAPRPLALLLWARILLLGGDLAGAAARAEETRRAASRPGAELGESDRVLLGAVELSTRGAPAAEWDVLVARSSGKSIEQEPIEVLELRARAALRAGRHAEARAALDEAARLAATVPNVMGDRLARAAAELGAAGAGRAA